MSHEDEDLRKYAERRANQDPWIDSIVASHIWASYQVMEKHLDADQAYHKAYRWVNSIEEL